VRRIVVSLALVVSLLAGCGQESDATLPGGYVLFKTDSLPKDRYLITTGSGSVVVPYSVAELAVKGQLVVGRVEKVRAPAGFDDEPERWTAPGYFVLDTASGALRLGLNEADWIADLKARGIHERPRLAISPEFDRRSSAYQ
jgi:hypothetical protein